MKKNSGSKVFLLLIVLALIFLGCDKEVKPDTVDNLGVLMVSNISIDDYEGFKKLFNKDSEDELLKLTFDRYKGMSAGAGIKNYQLITFSSGEMLLVWLTPKMSDGNYYIQSVIEVPEDMKEFFKK